MQQEKRQPLQNAVKIIRKIPLNWAREWIGLLFWKSYTWVYGVTGVLCGKIHGWQNYLHVLTSDGDTGEEMPGAGIAYLGVVYKPAFFCFRNVTLTCKNWLCAKDTFDLFPCTYSCSGTNLSSELSGVTCNCIPADGFIVQYKGTHSSAPRHRIIHTADHVAEGVEAATETQEKQGEMPGEDSNWESCCAEAVQVPLLLGCFWCTQKNWNCSVWLCTISQSLYPGTKWMLQSLSVLQPVFWKARV